MKTKLHYLRTLAAQNAKKAGVFFGASLASASAMADDAAISAAFGAVSSSATSLFSEAWPVVTLVMGGLVTIGLFKKAISRAT